MLRNLFKSFFLQKIIEEVGVDETGVDELGVDEMGSRRSGNKPLTPIKIFSGTSGPISTKFGT